MMETTKVAVYGTLKRGYGANRMLDSATFVGRGITEERYIMTDVGYPMIQRDSNGDVVEVEVYDSPDWQVLDRYEGVPNLYKRRIVNIRLDTGKVVPAYIYEARRLAGHSVTPIDNVYRWGYNNES